MPTLRIVTKAEQAVDNIRTFQQEIEANSRDNELVRTLSHFRSWFVLKENGRTLYAPSKWVGYIGLTAEDYDANNVQMDGRKTEAALRGWFAEVSAGPERNELMEGLNEYLANFAKKPSSLARVSVIRVGILDNASEDTAPNRLADALLTMYRILPREAQKEFTRLFKKEA
ncbi:hypothetical protein GPA27_01965 [Aromatoleum toluolicum]|uniref:Uncharacterized protein n=1 Tax=Aromatoleum toluolicum TaxID=90060 RepID=A0ABX1NA48_9RHOO|nr:hypothetical protein [Aromatoleum toluolicum]NMF96161.1 hypothetical protein [Aromatoleum toluolicum]